MNDRRPPTRPTSIRIQPTTSTSTGGFGSLWLTAKARMAPTAIRIRLTGRPIWSDSPAAVDAKRARRVPCSGLPGVEQERSWDPRVVVSESVAARRVFLEIGDRQERPEPGVHEVEAAATQLCGQGLRIGLHPEDRGPALACQLERLAGGIDARDDCSELRELSGRLTRAALQVEDPLLLEVGERAPDLLGEPALAGKRRCSLPVDFVPRASVVLGRFHQASRE